VTAAVLRDAIKGTLSVIERDATTTTVYKFNSAPFETVEQNSERASVVTMCVRSHYLRSAA
jgi:hypothetical protein